jgi:hypothetical protein
MQSANVYFYDEVIRASVKLMLGKEKVFSLERYDSLYLMTCKLDQDLSHLMVYINR